MAVLRAAGDEVEFKVRKQAFQRQSTSSVRKPNRLSVLVEKEPRLSAASSPLRLSASSPPIVAICSPEPIILPVNELTSQSQLQIPQGTVASGGVSPSQHRKPNRMAPVPPALFRPESPRIEARALSPLAVRSQILAFVFILVNSSYLLE